MLEQAIFYRRWEKLEARLVNNGEISTDYGYTDFKYPATLRHFGIDFIEVENSYERAVAAGHSTSVIVELPDGTLKSLRIEDIKFSYVHIQDIHEEKE